MIALSLAALLLRRSKWLPHLQNYPKMRLYHSINDHLALPAMRRAKNAGG